MNRIVRMATREAGSGRPPRPPRIRRRPLAWLCCAALAVSAVGVAAARSGGGTGPETWAAQPASSGCASAARAIDRPSDVPGNLLPPGTLLTSSKNLGAGRTLVVGITPHEFRRAVEFYVTKLPAAGYVNGAGDAEMGEAEALFVGEDMTGKWKVNGLPNCPNAVTVALLMIR
jgi:hypothetical protein